MLVQIFQKIKKSYYKIKVLLGLDKTFDIEVLDNDYFAVTSKRFQTIFLYKEKSESEFYHAR